MLWQNFLSLVFCVGVGFRRHCCGVRIVKYNVDLGVDFRRLVFVWHSLDALIDGVRRRPKGDVVSCLGTIRKYVLGVIS